MQTKIELVHTIKQQVNMVTINTIKDCEQIRSSSYLQNEAVKGAVNASQKTF